MLELFTQKVIPFLKKEKIWKNKTEAIVIKLVVLDVQSPSFSRSNQGSEEAEGGRGRRRRGG